MCKEKIKKGNKGTWALLLSIVALVLCIAVFLLWIFETIPHSVVTPDSFIGSCVALLSIIVTIAIGWQIFNVVEVKNTMKELKEKQEGVDELHKELKKEIEKVKQVTIDKEHHMLHLHAISLAHRAETRNNDNEAFYHYLTALSEALQTDDPMNVDELIVLVDDCSNKVEWSGISKDIHDDIKIIDETIKDSKHYLWIEKRYMKIHDVIVAKLFAK